MDEAKYELIEGGFLEALKIMDEDDEVVYDQYGRAYNTDNSNVLLYKDFADEWTESNLRFNLLSSKKWYKKKPFDVRQAMWDRPDEWVGKFYDDEFERTAVKVGFDSERMTVVKAWLGFDGDVSRVIVYDNIHNYMPSPKELDRCIPIEDVPEEAKR